MSYKNRKRRSIRRFVNKLMKEIHRESIALMYSRKRVMTILGHKGVKADDFDKV